MSGERYAGTRITDPPDLQGRGGAAWRVRMPPLGQRGRPDFDATVGIAIVHAPGRHALWDHWVLSVIHLRPIAGVREPHRQFPEASHELAIAALDPGRPLPPLDWTPETTAHWLSPLDVVEQFTAANDAVADQILELALRAIVLGGMSPDQDHRAWWRRAIADTARHFAQGVHQLRTS